MRLCSLNALLLRYQPPGFWSSGRCCLCSVNTPTKTRGVGAGKAADLTYWCASLLGAALTAPSTMTMCFI